MVELHLECLRDGPEGLIYSGIPRFFLQGVEGVIHLLKLLHAHQLFKLEVFAFNKGAMLLPSFSVAAVTVTRR